MTKPKAYINRLAEDAHSWMTDCQCLKSQRSYVMQGTWVVQLLNNGHVVPNSAQERATINAHPGVSKFLEDFFAIIWDDIVKAVAAYFGVASYDIAHAVALAKQIFGGSDKTYFVKGAVQLVESQKEYNQM
jgi:hypothetical protein